MNVSATGYFHRDIENAHVIRHGMVERFLPADDPVLEDVLVWTVQRDAQDMARLLQWLPDARSVREQRVLLQKIRALGDELEQAMEKMASLQQS